MRTAVIQFPGTNCERETSAALRRCGMEPVLFRWNEDHRKLSGFDGYVLAGGFSYEDRSRSGIIAALDPIIPVIKAEGARGKPVLGICNGAQILLEAGMVPNLSLTASAPEAALTVNKRTSPEGRILGTGFYNAWTTLRHVPPDRTRNPWYTGAFTSRFAPGECITVPSAHAEGRFLFPPGVKELLEHLGLIVFRYASPDGADAQGFPHNPNGSQMDAAALSNIAGNVLAIMPHPERTDAGDQIFHSMRDYMARQQAVTLPGTAPLALTPEAAPGPYSSPENTEEIIIRQIITDNHAVSVENTLQHQGIPVNITRHIHWEIGFDPGTSADERKQLLAKVHASGELYNSNKEIPLDPGRKPSGAVFLVREHEDITGKKACQALRSWFSCTGITSVTRSVLWSVYAQSQQHIDDVLKTHIFMNPHAYKGYVYGT